MAHVATFIAILNTRLPKGSGYHPLTVCRRLHQNVKQSDPGHLSSLFYILCGHFDEKNPGVPPTRCRVSSQSPRVWGRWLPPENILSCHFEKYLHDMDLKLKEHVRNTISLLYKQKIGWNSDIWNIFSEKINFGLYFAFHFGHALLRQCDVICWPIFMILVSMERGDPTLYYCTKQLYFGRVNFKLGRRVTKKDSGRRGLTTPFDNCWMSHSIN